jgi:hypothetical protein
LTVVDAVKHIVGDAVDFGLSHSPDPGGLAYQEWNKDATPAQRRRRRDMLGAAVVDTVANYFTGGLYSVAEQGARLIVAVGTDPNDAGRYLLNAGIAAGISYIGGAGADAITSATGSITAGLAATQAAETGISIARDPHHIDEKIFSGILSYGSAEVGAAIRQQEPSGEPPPQEYSAARDDSLRSEGQGPSFEYDQQMQLEGRSGDESVPSFGFLDPSAAGDVQANNFEVDDSSSRYRELLEQYGSDDPVQSEAAFQGLEMLRARDADIASKALGGIPNVEFGEGEMTTGLTNLVGDTAPMVTSQGAFSLWPTRPGQLVSGLLGTVGGATGLVLSIGGEGLSFGSASPVAVPLAFTSGYSLSAGLQNIYNSYQSIPRDIPSGVGEGIAAVVTNNNSNARLVGSGADLVWGLNVNGGTSVVGQTFNRSSQAGIPKYLWDVLSTGEDKSNRQK